ncbi:hypothetical protein [Thermogymnomonas acidicola]|uniref:hypothetical protein n=1 Tax=Thermogymnomonas acidicola TaxID=399579 RepID=UPI00094623D9|nr:hypothetical protein [Thermogymnomonas acidicola]
MGFIEVDRNTLNLKEHPEVFVAGGDAAKLPIDKTGSAAHFQATYIANRIAMEVGGNYTPSTYMGENAFNAATSVGGRGGMTFYSSYSSSPEGHLREHV